MYHMLDGSYSSSHCVSSFSFALNRVLALAKYSPNVSFSFMVIFLSWIPASTLLFVAP